MNLEDVAMPRGLIERDDPREDDLIFSTFLRLFVSCSRFDINVSTVVCDDNIVYFDFTKIYTICVFQYCSFAPAQW